MPVAQNRLCAAAHERFWRTLREDCVDHLSADVTLHDVNTRLLAFLDRTNHLDPRSSLLGASPGQRWVERPQRPEVTDDELLAALVVDVLRRVSNTWTVSVAGIDWDRARLDATATHGSNTTVDDCRFTESRPKAMPLGVAKLTLEIVATPFLSIQSCLLSTRWRADPTR